jgi:hypothetical protein
VKGRAVLELNIMINELEISKMEVLLNVFKRCVDLLINQGA